MKKAVQYLQSVHDAKAIIVYGSYADNSYHEASDFDALVICDKPKYKHDTTIVGGLPLDVYLYSPEEIEREIDPQEFIQIYNGVVLFDQDGMAERILKTVQEYVATINYKDVDQLRQEMEWCEKMYERTLRGDAVSNFRWHSLLTESLDIYCDIKQMHFLGPKKTLRIMEEQDLESYMFYTHAINWFEPNMLRNWIRHLRTIFDRVEKEHMRWHVERNG